jgi:anti-sigma-K factor RskA
MSDEKKRLTPEQAAEMEHIANAMAYYAGDLAGQEKADFEAHLPTCARCQKLLAEAPQLMADLDRLAPAAPTFTPKHTIDEQVVRFSAMVAEERYRRRQRVFRIAAIAAVALLVLGVALDLVVENRGLKNKMDGPRGHATSTGTTGR